MTFLVIMMFICLVWISFVTNRIPQTGREGILKGREINGTIINKNKTADRSATMKILGEDKKHYRVKLKPTEAHLWIKGDGIKIIVSEENPKKYRVLFNDYFRLNEKRIREHAVKLMKNGVSTYLIAAKSVKYTKDTADEIEKSQLSSQRIFSFVTYMRMFDLYSVFTALFIVCTIVYARVKNPTFTQILVPIALILIMLWFLYAAMNMCIKIIKEAKPKEN